MIFTTENLRMVPGRLLVKLVDNTVDDVLISVATKQAVMAEVILNSKRGNEEATYLAVGDIVVFDRMTSLPLKIQHNGEVCDFYIIKNTDVSAHASLEND